MVESFKSIAEKSFFNITMTR